MSKSFLDRLKQMVEETYGHRVLSAGDCLQLGEAIHQHTSYRLNINTLRRFFGLVKTVYKPSVGTLNILSQYCGFVNYSHFLQHNEKWVADEGEDKKELLHYLVSLFANTEVVHQNDPTFLSVVKQTVSLLEHQPRLLSSFQKAIAKTRNGQKFYFEQFIHIDQLASGYGEGLEHYLAVKKTPEAQLFGHALLCLRSWLTCDREAVVQHYQHVAPLTIDAMKNPYLCGQYFASSLFYAAVTGKNIERVAAEARHFYGSMKPSKENYPLFPDYEMVLAEALLLVRQYEEALFYIEVVLKKRENELPDYFDRQLYHTFRLFYAVALAGAGIKAKAREAGKKIDNNQFYYLRKKYYSIYYLLFRQWCGQQGLKTATQLVQLIERTGFSFFKQYTLQQQASIFHLGENTISKD